MTVTLDFNVFIYSIISEKCAKKVNKTYHTCNFRNIILKSIVKELEPKLSMLYTFFSIMKTEISKNKSLKNKEDFDKISKSKAYLSAKNKLTNIIKQNKKDVEHLSFCNCYIVLALKHKNKVSFVSLDKRHILKNKEAIENAIHNLIIDDSFKINLEKVKMK